VIEDSAEKAGELLIYINFLRVTLHLSKALMTYMESVGIQCNVDLWHKIDPCIYERWFKHHRFEPTFIDIELKAAKFLKEKNFDEFFLLLDTFDLYSVFGTKYSVLEDLVMENRIEHAKRFALKAGMKQRLAELMCNEKFAKQAARMVKSEMFNW